MLEIELSKWWEPKIMVELEGEFWDRKIFERETNVDKRTWPTGGGRDDFPPKLQPKSSRIPTQKLRGKYFWREILPPKVKLVPP